MEVITIVTVLALGCKLCLFVGGALGVSSSLNYLHQKKIKLKGGKDENQHDGESSIGLR